MTSQDNDNLTSSDDLLSDLIGTSVYDYSTPAKKEFLPWHRPRKQFVREKQWLKLIEELVTKHIPETGIIKYLGLPGDDFLDLRYFHDNVCVPNKLKLKYLGFNKGLLTKAKDQIEISLDEVRRMSNVDISSQLLPDDLTSIALSNSLAWESSHRIGPFDILNIDLCDSFASQPVNEFKATHYNTLGRLMTLQARRKDPWLLLLTTRTNVECIDEDVFDKLKQLYLENLASCEKFSSSSLEHFSFNDQNGLDIHCNSAHGFSNVFLVSLCKWILKLGLGQNPPAILEVRSVLGYKVADAIPSPDLISIAIKITPTLNSGIDAVGLANIIDKSVDECQHANKILNRIYQQKDVDEILSSNDTLMNEMLEASKKLLVQARYDVADYDQWARISTK